MVLTNCSSLEIILIIIKQCTIALEHSLNCTNHGNIFLISQDVQCMLVCEYILLMKAKFHLV
jgi:hypothetical protein